ENARADARRRLSAAIAAATRLGASTICMVTGGHGSLTWEEAAQCFSDAIAPCVAEAGAAGIALTIEPAVPGQAHRTIVHNLRDTVTLAEMAGIGVCIDVFPCWSEGGLRATIERAAPRLGLIQVSDYVYGDLAIPARAVPGDGAIPLEQMFEWIVGV